MSSMEASGWLFSIGLLVLVFLGILKDGACRVTITERIIVGTCSVFMLPFILKLITAVLFN